MTCLYAKFQKSCTATTGYIPVRASGKHEIFDSPLYLQHVGRYKKTVQAQCRFTLSKQGKHLSSLFQHRDGPWSFGDIFKDNDALLVLIEDLTMEVFVFPGQRAMAETFYMNVSKLPLNEIRLQSRPVMISKYQRQLECYRDKQLSFI